MGGTRAAVAAAIIDAKANGGGHAEAVAALQKGGYWPLDEPYHGFVERYFT